MAEKGLHLVGTAGAPRTAPSDERAWAHLKHRSRHTGAAVHPALHPWPVATGSIVWVE
jgi:hypothetical protein